jgi:hypothetical protein
MYFIVKDKRDEESLNHQLSFRVSAVFGEVLKQGAKARGLSQSDYNRLLLEFGASVHMLVLMDSESIREKVGPDGVAEWTQNIREQIDRDFRRAFGVELPDDLRERIFQMAEEATPE